MSAYLCDSDTFDYLATAADLYARGGSTYIFHADRPLALYPDLAPLAEAGILRQGIEIGGGVCTISAHEPEIVRAILYAANVASVRARYSDADRGGMLGPLDEYREVCPADLDPVAIIKTCHCVSYQSCETETWQQTIAYKILGAIERSAIRKLRGYDDAPWGWTRKDAPERGQVISLSRLVTRSAAAAAVSAVVNRMIANGAPVVVAVEDASGQGE